jgi:hypothetical protein
MKWYHMRPGFMSRASWAIIATLALLWLEHLSRGNAFGASIDTLLLGLLLGQKSAEVVLNSYRRLTDAQRRVIALARLEAQPTGGRDEVVSG